MASYSESEKSTALAALEANGGNVSQTARDLNIPRKTLEHWSNGHGVNDDVAKDCQIKKRDLADELEKLAMTLVDAIPEKIDDATLQHTAVTLGITLDKMQLLRGKPTAINQDMTDPEKRRARIDELIQKRNGIAANGESNGERTTESANDN